MLHNHPVSQSNGRTLQCPSRPLCERSISRRITSGPGDEVGIDLEQADHSQPWESVNGQTGKVSYLVDKTIEAKDKVELID